MTPTEQTIIYPSRRKMVGQTILCIAFVALGLWLLTNKGILDNTLVDRYRLNLIIGALTILIFGSFLTIWIFKLLDRKPGVIVDENVIVDNSTFISIGKVPWSDIESVKLSTYSSNVITVLLKDPNKYIEQQQNPVIKKLLKANYEKSGSPVNIQTLSLETDVESLKKILNEQLCDFNKSEHLID